MDNKIKKIYIKKKFDKIKKEKNKTVRKGTDEIEVMLTNTEGIIPR